MKVQELLAPYLYEHKKLTLPGIGTFDLNAAIDMYDLKEEAWPADAITFQPDARALIDEAFLQYLMQQTGKMKTLALSDLDSYLNIGMQLLNIGKPFQLNGIGTISKSSNGRVTFVQGQPVTDKSVVPETHYRLKDRTRLPDNAGKEFDFETAEKVSSRKPFVIAATILALALLSWAIYLAIPKQERDTIDEEKTEIIAPPPPDASTTTADTPNTVVPVAATNQAIDTTSGFKMVLQKFRNATTAQNRFAILKARGHNVVLIEQDSMYQIVLQVYRPLQDTAYVRDSLQRWYRLAAKLLQQ